MSHRAEEKKTTELLTEDLIDSRLGVHDSHHFEAKLDYTIHSKLGSNCYQVETYFFIPRSLGINRYTYSATQFYSDVQAYIRFKTPSISLETLARADDSLSPLKNIGDLIGQLRSAPKSVEARQKLGQELRLFGCVCRAKVRDQVRNISERLAEVEEDSEASAVISKDVVELSSRLTDDLQRVVAAWRGLRADFLSGGLPRQVRETYEYVDEYLSLVFEEKLTNLVRKIDAGRRAQPLLEVRERLCELLVAEQRHREGAGYLSLVRARSDNEHYVYRQGMLKKFVMSVLWLDISKEKEGKGTANLGASIAAGTAMFFALMATILNTRYYMTNTAGFVVAATITYILKDRIKDGLKHFFSSKVSRWLADYSVRIRDPITDNDIGRCREAFSYVALSDVPTEVTACRQRDATVSIESLAKPEVVIKYEKDIRLESSAIIRRLHVDHYDINDIMRFSVAQLLDRADDPISLLPVYDPESDKVERRKFHKVYHLNVVMVFRAKSAPDEATMKRIRVVFDKQGICRLEEVC